MSEKVRETIQAIFSSRKFSPFFSGVKFSLLGCRPVTLRIHGTNRSQRAPGYRFVKHSIVTEVRSDAGISAFGFGESDVELLALQRSIAEGVERSVFKAAKALHPEFLSSNGWAAHTSPENARSAAQRELLERDAALLHWLSQTPLQEIKRSSWPKAIRGFALDELSLAPRFNRLRILMTHLGAIPTVTTIIHDQLGFGFISHATASTLDGAMGKALVETCRIADLFCKGFMTPGASDPPRSPEAHAVYYASKAPIPEWLFGRRMLHNSAAVLWNERLRDQGQLKMAFSFNDIACGPLYVTHCQSRDVQDLFFGTASTAAQRGWINFSRFEKVCGVRTLCPQPHFVP